MEVTFRNKLKVWWHHLRYGLFHDFVISEGHVFCVCGYGDTRPLIEGVDPEYRRMVERAAYADEPFDIPN